jgi:hypothetical protein
MKTWTGFIKTQQAAIQQPGWFCLLFSLLLGSIPMESSSQIVINEGSNRNFSTVLDEDGNAKDWIELYNAGDEAVDLVGYSLTDNLDSESPWVFPNYLIQPGDYLLVFCSGKNRFYVPPFQQVAYDSFFVPQEGWNIHSFDEPYQWDGTSDIVINTCSYNPSWNTNSIFNQSVMGYSCSLAAFDNPESICSESYGETYTIRPNIQLNGISIGDGNINNSTSNYPAPYGNWWECARNQSLYKAEELIAAGVLAGPIESLAWDVASTENVTYSYIDISLKQINIEELTTSFVDNTGLYFHTNFKLNSNGEVVYLLAPDESILHQLEVNCSSIEMSVGSSFDGAGDATILYPPSPGSSNNGSEAGLGTIEKPLLSLESGVYQDAQTIDIDDVSGLDADIHYTLNGDEPTISSTLYTGQEISFSESTVIRARAFKEGYIPSSISSESYLIGISHTTPIVSVVIEDDLLNGPDGIFTNWWEDWERYAQVMYFDSSDTHPLLFEREVAIQVDGGAGGSRSHPQTSFRLELAKGSLAEEPVAHPLLPNRPEREQYSKIYLRNGSNMWLSLPYKDGCQVEMMMAETKGYFSAMRAASVYINGEYFGVYEMREKLDAEFFKVYDDYTLNDVDVLSLTNWNGGQLRATDGNVENYWESWEAFSELDPFGTDFVQQADQLYDMDYLSDYIIAETWMGNTDWPWNNIKISRSDATDYRWRFSTIDLESCLWPWGWTDCTFNGLQYVLDLGLEDPYTGVWSKSIQNQGYRIYFINRYADILNTSYRIERLLAMENSYYDRWLPEMLNEYERWVDPGNIEAWHESFINNHQLFQQDLICKSEVIRDQVQDIFNLTGQVTLTLDAEPVGGGLIHINTITPQDLPWDGIYYQGVPVTITAEAAEGYSFQFWLNNGEIDDISNPQWSGELNMEAINFTAVFDSQVSVDEDMSSESALVISPNPVSDFLWVENPDQRITGWEILSMNGQIIDSKHLSLSSQRLLIPTENLTSALYLLRVNYLDGQQETGRFVKAEY